MLVQEIQAELLRLQLHPVNLGALPGENGNVLLRGSLLAHWDVPQTVAGEWFLELLKSLPDVAGPEATMNAFRSAHAEQMRAG